MYSSGESFLAQSSEHPQASLMMHVDRYDEPTAAAEACPTGLSVSKLGISANQSQK
jgi:hypothetical protein